MTLKNAWLKEYEKERLRFEYVKRYYSHFDDVNYFRRRYFINKDGELKNRRKLRASTYNQAKIMFTGALNCGRHQVKDACVNNEYKFNYQFEKVVNILAQSDLAVGSLETAVFPGLPYAAKDIKNLYNAPYEFLKAVRKSGIDAVVTGNKKMLSAGAVAAGETADTIERFGLINTGLFNNSEKKRYEILNINGIKIALVSLYAKSKSDLNITNEGFEVLLNTYQKKTAQRLLENARDDGAEVVFACVSWRYKNQQEIANELAQLGYDCVVGYARHGAQHFECINANGKNVPVFYSLGNLVCGSIEGEKSRSIIACIDLNRNDDGSINLSYSYIPAFVSGKYKDRKYMVLPLRADSVMSENTQRVDLIAETLGNEISIAADVGYGEYYED